MANDEAQIRTLIATWIAASKAGDVATVLALMTDDAQFLLPGRAPMRKADFAAAFMAAKDAPCALDFRSDIQEITVAGDLAYTVTHLTVTMTPKDGRPPMARAGNTLSILRKVDGRWLLARDANLLAPVNGNGG